VCTAYNADFDGDQMAVHLPLSTEAQAEARLLMLSVNNILAPKDGRPITTPTQDMVLGSYYLTVDIPVDRGEGKVFKDYEELLHAYYSDDIDLHARVKVRRKLNEEDRGKLVESTVGRFKFNEHSPQDLGFVNREKDHYSLEVDKLVDKQILEEIVEKCYSKHGNTVTAAVLDHIKEVGYHYSTIGAVTISMSDVE